MTSNKTRIILLIDDHAVFRDGLRLLLSGLQSRMELLEAATYEAAECLLEQEAALDLDLVLLDLGLPGIAQMEALRRLREKLPEVPIVVLSADETPWAMEQALRLGARGYIPKATEGPIIVQAIELVLAGGTYVPAEILSWEEQRRNDDLCARLTPRQCQIMQQLCLGLSNKEIAKTLGLSESTVRAHVGAILKALGVGSRAKAIQLAMRSGWVRP